MADHQDVLDKNSFAGVDGPSDTPGVWGGQAPGKDDSGYTGGYHDVPDGTGGVIHGAPNDPAAYNAALKWTPSGRQQDVDRYRQMGDQAANRAGVALNYGASDAWGNTGAENLDRAGQARAQQQDVAGVMRNAAMGNAPSRAELLGRGLIDQSLKSQLAGAASARGGPLAQMAAQRQAAQGAAGFRQQGMNQLSALRADEMERARSAWGQQVGQIRGQDYQGAGVANAFSQTEAQKAQAQGDLEARQRQLNQQAQMGYEGMAWDTNNAVMQAQNGQKAQDQQSNQFDRQMQQQDEDRSQRNTAAAVGGVSSVVGGTIAHSDMRTKKPMPLLLDSGRKPKAAAPSFISDYMDKENASRDADQAQQDHAQRMDQMRQAPVLPHQDIARDDPYAPPTPGGIQREDPYGSGEMFFSDENAKKAAFDAGVARATKALTGDPGAKHPASERMSGISGRLIDSAPWDLATPTPASLGPLAFKVAGSHAFTDASQAAREEESKQPPPAPRQMTSFKRDETSAPEEFRSDERSKNLSKQADDIMAGYKQSEAAGPSVGGRDDLSRAADDMGRQMGADHEARMAQGPAVKSGGPLVELQQDANRRMAGFPYAYKDEFTPPEQTHGELNYGPSAQELEKNPITATTVKKDPNGMRAVDVHKLVKTQSAGIASLQDQIDKMRQDHEARMAQGPAVNPRGGRYGR